MTVVLALTQAPWMTGRKNQFPLLKCCAADCVNRKPVSVLASAAFEVPAEFKRKLKAGQWHST